MQKEGRENKKVSHLRRSSEEAGKICVTREDSWQETKKKVVHLHQCKLEGSALLMC